MTKLSTILNEEKYLPAYYFRPSKKQGKAIQFLMKKSKASKSDVIRTLISAGIEACKDSFN